MPHITSESGFAAQLAEHEHANMQQMHMSHQQQYDMAQQQAHQDQQQYHDPHVGHKREAEDADCASPHPAGTLSLTQALICHVLHQELTSSQLPSPLHPACLCGGSGPPMNNLVQG